ncbi:MAG: PhoU domain-containing protein, partial [Candidatus Helarchaeota archaeon]
MKKISFEPISVKDSICKMKNIAELMIDLAYTALLFENMEIAYEVMKLEEEVHVLTYLVDMNTMLAVRDRKDAEQLEPIIRIGYDFDRISNAIADIAKITINKLSLHPSLFEAIRQSEEPLIRAIVLNKEINNKTIGKLKIRTETGCDILAIRRGNGWIFDPDKNTKLKLNDVLFARGSSEGNQVLCNMTGRKCTRGGKEDEKIPIELEEEINQIKGYLLEMKNYSEIMIALAFSAILFNNREIAEDVFEMEERLDFLQLELQKSVLANAKCINDPTRLVALLRIGN